MGNNETHQAKSHPLTHFALSQLLFVQGVPYTNGLNLLKCQIAKIARTAPICNRTLGLSIDVAESNTAHDKSIAK